MGRFDFRSRSSKVDLTIFFLNLRPFVVLFNQLRESRRNNARPLGSRVFKPDKSGPQADKVLATYKSIPNSNHTELVNQISLSDTNRRRKVHFWANVGQEGLKPSAINFYDKRIIVERPNKISWSAQCSF